MEGAVEVEKRRWMQVITELKSPQSTRQWYLEAEVLDNVEREENQNFKLLAYFRKFLDDFLYWTIHKYLLNTCDEPNTVLHAYSVLLSLLSN